jgi:hypothetical protein
MKSKVQKETIRIRSVVGLHGAIEYFHTMYGLEATKVTLSDGLPVVSVTHVWKTMRDGTKSSEIILSDRWPKGAIESKTYEIYRVIDEEE